VGFVQIGFVWPDEVRFCAARGHGVLLFYAGATDRIGFVWFLSEGDGVDVEEELFGVLEGMHDAAGLLF